MSLQSPLVAEEDVSQELSVNPPESKPRLSERLRQFGPPLGIFVFVVGLWQIFVTALHLPVYIFPTPSAIVTAAIDNLPSLLQSAYHTFISAMLGFLLSGLFGVLVAVVMSQSKWIERSLSPYAVVLQTIPIVAVAPILIVWFGAGFTAIVAVSFIIAVFPVISNTVLGLNSVDTNLANLLRLYHASRWQFTWKLRIPTALPYIVGGLRISAGSSLIGAIVGEYVAGIGGSQGGLGYSIIVAATQLHMDYLFAAALTACIMGILVYLGVGQLGRLLLGKWHESSIVVEN